MRQIEILDTTLRDGEQAPGAALGAAAKLRMAQSLADLGVDAIEAGFPAASAEELEAVRDIARAVDGSTIVALARATGRDWFLVVFWPMKMLHRFMTQFN